MVLLEPFTLVRIRVEPINEVEMTKTLTPPTIGSWSIVKKRHSFSIATLAPPVDENRNSFFYRWNCLFTNALKKQVSP